MLSIAIILKILDLIICVSNIQQINNYTNFKIKYSYQFVLTHLM